MKTFFLLLLVLCSSSKLFSQNFFPLQQGNQYQIEKHKWGNQPMGISWNYKEYYKRYIEKDTVLHYAGYTFYRFNDQEKWFAYDPVEQRIFIKYPDNDTIYLGVDFNIPAGEVFYSHLHRYPGSFKSLGITTVVFNNDTLRAFEMHSLIASQLKYKFVENIGQIAEVDSFGFPYYSINRHNLIGFIVDTFILNPITLSFSEITILNDRPVNSMPLGIEKFFTGNYPSLIDSVYIELKVLRSEDSLILHTKHKSIKITETHYFTSILIDTSLIKAGDIVKYRSVMKDSSIFNTRYFYPDTGYIEFTLLPEVPVSAEDLDIVSEFRLFQNYPNPFNPVTKIKYSVPANDTYYRSITLKIYDILGNEISTLVNESKPPGIYEVDFNAGNLPSGVYFYRLQTGSFVETKKMILLR